MASAAGRMRSTSSARSPSPISAPSTRMRSWNRSRYGEVFSPTRYPAACNTEAMHAQVLPLPLVPATWTNFIPRWGSPRARSSARMRSRPGACCSQWKLWI